MCGRYLHSGGLQSLEQEAWQTVAHSGEQNDNLLDAVHVLKRRQFIERVATVDW